MSQLNALIQRGVSNFSKAKTPGQTWMQLWTLTPFELGTPTFVTCVGLTQVDEDGVLVGSELLQELLVGGVLARGVAGHRLPEKVLLAQKLPDLATVLPGHSCQDRSSDSSHDTKAPFAL